MVMMVFHGGAYDKAASDAINAARGVGDNLPPDPFTLYSESIADLLLEADNFLDGKPIENEDQEAAVASILTRLRREANAADDQRKAEKKPHDDAGKAVQAKWQPLLAKADLAVTTCKNALTARLEKVAAEQRAAAQAATQEAERLAEAAAQTAASAKPDSLADQSAVEHARNAAHEAAQRANRLDKARPQAKGGERAVGLRSHWVPTLVKPIDALRHYMIEQPEPLREWLLEQARKDVRVGKREIPGFEIKEEKAAA